MRPRPAHFLVLALALGAAAARAAAGSASDAALEALETSRAGLRRVVLDNGTIGLIRSDRSAPVAAVQIWVATGSAHEDRFLGAGITHAIEHMIFKGTARRAVGAISREIDDAGGDINAYTSLDRTVFHTDLPSAAWKTGLDVLADAVMHASFPEGEWEKERQVIMREISMGNDNPDRVLSKLAWDQAFRAHPYRFPVIGLLEIFETVSRDDLAAHFARRYAPDNMIVAVVGDVDPEEVEAELRRQFAAFKRRPAEPVILAGEPAQLAPRFARKTGAYELSRLVWMFHTVPLTHPDAVALDVLAQIVGHGRSSRLVGRVREKLGLVHDISAWSFTPREAGVFGIDAEFDPEREEAVIAALRAEAEAWPETRFTAAEIARAVRQLLVGELSGLQSAHGQASAFASGEFYAGDPGFASLYVRRLQAVTAADLRAAAGRYLRPANGTLAVVAPQEAAPPAAAADAAAPPATVARIALANGVRVLLRRDARLPFVHVCAALRGGLLTETADNNGITRLMSETLLRGTRRRSADEIAGAVESRGGSLSAFSGRNAFGLQARCLAQDAPLFMDILAECLREPAFSAGELERQRQRQLAAIGAQRERPFFVAQEQLRQTLFAGHPYRWDPLGTSSNVLRLAPGDLRDYLRARLAPEDLVVSLFGSLDAAAARRLVERAFGNLPAGGRRAPAVPPAAPSLPASLVRREPREQAVVLVGFPGVSLFDPAADALAALDTAASGLSSDLSAAVREARGLAYYVGSYQDPGLDPGSLVFYAGTREDAAAEVQKLLVAEAARIRAGGLRGEELERARRKIVADHDMALQDNMGLAMQCALDELYGLGYDHALNVRKRFEALTLDDVRAAAERVLSTNRMAVSVVLPE